MPASADYLTKYLTATSTSKVQNTSNDFEDSSRPKKKRKKDKSHALESTLKIADDDDGLSLSSRRRKDEDDEDGYGPVMFEGRIRSAEFRKKKSSAWAAVQDEDAAEARGNADDASAHMNGDGGNVDEDAEAERIIADAAKESNARRIVEQDEEAPAVVDTEMVGGDGPRMSSGAKAGLQTAADTAALMAAEEAREVEEERRAKKKARRKDGEKDREESSAVQEQETIYRDATGRRIDISMRRQEARAAELAKLQAEKKEREDAMGEVQLQQREQRKQDLEEAKFLTLGRSAEDEELNERQKEELRWDDPMAQYMAERQAEQDAEEAAKNPKKKGKKGEEDLSQVVRAKKREYAGAAPPNRYGIKPGWRWDGVDRGTGFEKEWFQARGKKARNENLEYQWAMDE